MDTVPWYNTSLDTNNQTTNYASIARIDADVRTKKQEFKSIDTKYSIICCFWYLQKAYILKGSIRVKLIDFVVFCIRGAGRHPTNLGLALKIFCDARSSRLVTRNTEPSHLAASLDKEGRGIPGQRISLKFPHTYSGGWNIWFKNFWIKIVITFLLQS